MHKQNSFTLDIFKFQVYQTILKVDVDKIKKFCFSLKKKDKGRSLSNLTGWQSQDLDLFNLPDYMKKLKELIESHANDYGKNMHINKPLTLANMWININEHKDANDPHIHPYSVFSGSFYIDVAEDSGGLKFWNPAHETMGYAFNDNISKYEQTKCSTWIIVSMSSMLVLFPGYIKHSVGPNMNKKLKRISISFNLVT